MERALEVYEKKNQGGARRGLPEEELEQSQLVEGKQLGRGTSTSEEEN